MKELGIEAKLEKLMEWMRVIHDRLDIHEWTRNFRPWDAADHRHPGKKCGLNCTHDIYHIECACGAERAATKEEFDAAKPEYSGYY